MQSNRTLRVRMDGMGPWHFTCSFFTGLALVAIAMVVGWTGPPVLALKPAAPEGLDVVLWDAVSARCDVAPNGNPIPPIGRCWSHFFSFTSRWTQSFDVQMQAGRLDAYPNLPAATVPFPLSLSWYGLREGGNPKSDWELIYSGNTTRYVRCASGSYACNPVVLFRTNSVHFQRYFVRIALPPDFDGAAVQQPDSALSAVTFYIRYKTADFSMFELGFKTTYMVLSIIVLVVFLVYTGLDCGCGRYFFCIPRSAAPLTWQRQQGVNWLLVLLVGLIMFNEPLLWMRYYAQRDGGVIAYLSVGGQLTFVAILLAYWLVEWGLIKSNPTREPIARPCRFYCPKLTAIFVYWLLAVAVYGWILIKQSEDPLFDWAEYAYATVQGDTGPNARLFLILWSALLAGLYLVYLLWLITRSLTVMRSFSRGEKYLFSLHFLVLFATALGIAGGAIYDVEVGSAFDFMFFNAVFNVSRRMDVRGGEGEDFFGPPTTSFTPLTPRPPTRPCRSTSTCSHTSTPPCPTPSSTCRPAAVRPTTVPAPRFPTPPATLLRRRRGVAQSSRWAGAATKEGRRRRSLRPRPRTRAPSPSRWSGTGRMQAQARGRVPGRPCSGGRLRGPLRPRRRRRRRTRARSRRGTRPLWGLGPRPWPRPRARLRRSPPREAVGRERVPLLTSRPPPSPPSPPRPSGSTPSSPRSSPARPSGPSRRTRRRRHQLQRLPLRRRRRRRRPQLEGEAGQAAVQGAGDRRRSRPRRPRRPHQ
jgi:hypothetical protein